MPIFEFKCQRCDNSFEELILGESSGVSCPKCKSNRVTKMLSAFSFKSEGRYTSSAGSSGCSGCSSHQCSSCK